MSLENPFFVFAIVLFFFVVISLVISMHEASHAWMANRLGDPTARLLGRITLNPRAHIDPLGTFIVPIILLIFTGFVFGWAKPTPINPLNFKNPRQDAAISAFAGPASNFILAAFLGVISRLLPIATSDKNVIVGLGLSGRWSSLFELIAGNILLLIFFALAAIIILNLILGIFNLIPVPPLDGWKVLMGIVPKNLALRLSAFESYGPIFLLIFIFFFFRFFAPIISVILNLFMYLLLGTSF